MDSTSTPLRPWSRAVVKVGSALVAPDGVPSDVHLGAIARFVVESRAAGREVVVVSSGAVAAGRAALGGGRPRTIPEKQALAAVGQPRLMGHWGRFLDAPTAQVLLTHDDLVHRDRFLNARNTLAELLGRGVVPVVNENDTVAVDELKVGDNDNLAAHVAVLAEADLLVILTDVDGLFDADPRTTGSARLVPVVDRVDAGVHAFAGGAGTDAGTGGMRTKLQAAEKATSRGIDTVLVNGTDAARLGALAEGALHGTLFRALDPPLPAKKHWLLHATPVAGRLVVDAGAADAVCRRGASLLAPGVVAVAGDFGRGEPVEVADEAGRVLARGIVRYAAHELVRVRGRQSGELEAVLGYAGPSAVVHRDDLALLETPDPDG
ncbi:glutamate 5-kinase [Rubrivirga marina]|uniref:Glutamate 5-kinase n=1 Tax=Rubrivirga marina TaxID=1196024 RepID=A0A271J635_9BACT|nr:glutamate 5-kinase [Rubrivirga marina]PAP78415.1 glutamate 5-kinase [Rubrivirga marina]